MQMERSSKYHIFSKRDASTTILRSLYKGIKEEYNNYIIFFQSFSTY